MAFKFIYPDIVNVKVTHKHLTATDYNIHYGTGTSAKLSNCSTNNCTLILFILLSVISLADRSYVTA